MMIHWNWGSPYFRTNQIRFDHLCRRQVAQAFCTSMKAPGGPTLSVWLLWLKFPSTHHFATYTGLYLITAYKLSPIQPIRRSRRLCWKQLSPERIPGSLCLSWFQWTSWISTSSEVDHDRTCNDKFNNSMPLLKHFETTSVSVLNFTVFWRHRLVGFQPPTGEAAALLKRKNLVSWVRRQFHSCTLIIFNYL